MVMLFRKFSFLWLLFVLIQWLVSCNASNEKNNKTSSKNNCPCDDLILDELYNHFYLEERNQPFTGICYELYPNQNIKLTKEFLNGKLHGNMLRYRADSSKISLVEFKDNFIHGKAIFYNQRGEDSVVQHYKRGELISNGH